jgi:hypothetical protein
VFGVSCDNCWIEEGQRHMNRTFLLRISTLDQNLMPLSNLGHYTALWLRKEIIASRLNIDCIDTCSEKY